MPYSSPYAPYPSLILNPPPGPHRVSDGTRQLGVEGSRIWATVQRARELAKEGEKQRQRQPEERMRETKKQCLEQTNALPIKIGYTGLAFMHNEPTFRVGGWTCVNRPSGNEKPDSDVQQASAAVEQEQEDEVMEEVPQEPEASEPTKNDDGELVPRFTTMPMPAQE